MRAAAILAIGLQAVSSVAALGSRLHRRQAGDEAAAAEQLDEIAQMAYDKTKAEVSGGAIQARDGCNSCNMRIRREWGSLTRNERLDYINAVKCLQAKPSRYPADVAPGARSRFDDFVVTHINQTMTIHFTANFLTWHRYYVWAYETALRDECGYAGAQPYWNWGITAITGLKESPIFDGSDTSFSGDGAPVPGKPDHLVLGAIRNITTYVPTGDGGGCVTSGPFKDMEVNLGPWSLSLPGGGIARNPDGQFAYNPRCLKRDLTDAVNREHAGPREVLRNVAEPRNITEFQNMLQGAAQYGPLGLHGGGHYAIGGEPARDVFVSPGDPVFYLHHGMIDRVWWMWQMMNPEERVFSEAGAVGGTRTLLNNPPSAEGTADDPIDLERAFGPALKIRDLLSTVHGPLCYAYL